MPIACSIAPGVSAWDKGSVAPAGSQLLRRGGQREPPEANAHDTAAQPEDHHLQQVYGHHLPGSSTEAFQHRDALQLLVDEHARDARHADAAEHDDDQSDQAEVVLGALQVLADFVLGRPVRAGGHEGVPEIGSQSRHEGFDAPLIDLQHHLVARAAAEREQACLRQGAVVDDHARAEAEAADAPPGLVLDDAANGERQIADQDLIAFADAQLGQQLRPDERPAVAQQRVAIRCAAAQIERAVERKSRLHAAQLHHPRDALPASAGLTIVAVSMLSVRVVTPRPRRASRAPAARRAATARRR